MRKEHYSKEFTFQEYVKNYFISKGHEIINPKQENRDWRAYPDIISKLNDIIYLPEINFCLERSGLTQGMGQLIIYKYCYYPNTKTKLCLVAPKDNCLIGIHDKFIKYLKQNYKINVLLL